MAPTRRALNPTHLLHEVVNRDVQPPRLKSRHPFASEAQTLIHHAQTKKTPAHWTGNEWHQRWQSASSPLKKYIPDTYGTSPGSDLPRHAWVKLNRLRTGVGRFRASMHRWGLVQSPICECGKDEQTAEHIINVCHLHRPPHGAQGLLEVDVPTRDWLLNSKLEI